MNEAFSTRRFSTWRRRENMWQIENDIRDRQRFKSFYWNTWLKIDKCIKLRTFLSRIY